MFLLAQLPAEAVSPMVQFLIGGSAALFLLNQAITFWKEHMRERPTPSDTYATKEEHEALVSHVRETFNALNEDRRKNVARLHEKIDALIERAQSATNDLRGEVKEDLSGLHERITQLLGAFSELKGAVTTLLKNSNHPFSR